MMKNQRPPNNNKRLSAKTENTKAIKPWSLSFGDKWIPWPGIGQVNKRSIAPIVDNRFFRRLSDKRQLAFAYLVFPGATHDRRQHAMGAYYRTLGFTEKMKRLRLLDEHEARNLNLFALLHDIGHGPFSHVIEVFTTRTHHVYGAQILDQMAKEIKQCGGDLAFLKRLMLKKDPRAKVVSDKNFGMEKLDYLIRDQEATNFGPNIRQCVESVFNHLLFRDGEMRVDLKALDSAIEIQRAYIYFYRNVHLEKSNYLIQRFMQKMIFQLLNIPAEQGGINENELWEMVDGDLLYALKKSNLTAIRHGIALFDQGVKHFPKTSIALRLEGYGWLERRAGKPIVVQELPKSFFDCFFRKSTPGDLEKIEIAIANLLDLQPWQVAISHIVERNRFIPQDILFFDGMRDYSLQKQDPQYFQLLEKEMDKYLCVRICAVPQYREYLTSREKEVTDLVFKYLGFKAQ